MFVCVCGGSTSTDLESSPKYTFKKKVKSRICVYIFMFVFFRDICVYIMHMFSCKSTESGRKQKKVNRRDITLGGSGILLTLFLMNMFCFLQYLIFN